jgi:nucleoside-diphosphate-sugar epimerase
MAQILIAGCGYVGTALGLRLAATGHVVWGLRRSAEGLPPGIRSVEADLTAPETLQKLPPELDAVFYTAAPNGGARAAGSITPACVFHLQYRGICSVHW